MYRTVLFWTVAHNKSWYIVGLCPSMLDSGFIYMIVQTMEIIRACHCDDLRPRVKVLQALVNNRTSHQRQMILFDLFRFVNGKGFKLQLRCTT